jgi:hypothetical protein
VKASGFGALIAVMGVTACLTMVVVSLLPTMHDARPARA